MRITRNHPLIKVVRYRNGRLSRLFRLEIGATRKTLRTKPQLVYFEEYFGELGAKTIVIERRYTDRDWLEDYANFYVRCLEKYASRCTRLHFFTIEFSYPDLQAAVADSTHPLARALQQPPVEGTTPGYLGFVVLKPLPKAFVGRTCLKTYPSSLTNRSVSDERHYPITRICEAHLLGFDLQVRSLPFQEQDTVAAACATSALWSALHATAKLFHHPILSPIEITRNATATLPSDGRDVPSHGLTMPQMADAVRRAMLTPEVLRLRDSAQLRTIARAYLSAGIPLVMMGQLIEHSSPTSQSTSTSPTQQVLGGHAITVTGYRMEPSVQCSFTGPPPEARSAELDALCISKLYAHDDGIGPFARMEFLEEEVTVRRADGSTAKYQFHLSTSWRLPQRPANTVTFAPVSVLLPLYHKIRLPLLHVLYRYVFFHDAGMKKKHLALFGQSAHLRWDVVLTTNAVLRAKLRTCGQVPSGELVSLLESAWPRFIWEITAKKNGRDVVKMLLDATDIPKGNYVLTKPLVLDATVSDILLDDDP